MIPPSIELSLPPESFAIPPFNAGFAVLPFPASVSLLRELALVARVFVRLDGIASTCGREHLDGAKVNGLATYAPFSLRYGTGSSTTKHNCPPSSASLDAHGCHEHSCDATVTVIL